MKLNFMRGWSDLRAQLSVAVIALIALIAVGTVAYHLMEKWSWVSSFYFSVCTLTTVGYGDFVPTTDVSRLFTAGYVIVGVTIAFTTIGLIGAGYSRRSQDLLKRVRALEEKAKE